MKPRSKRLLLLKYCLHVITKGLTRRIKRPIIIIIIIKRIITFKTRGKSVTMRCNGSNNLLHYGERVREFRRKEG